MRAENARLVAEEVVITARRGQQQRKAVVARGGHFVLRRAFHVFVVAFGGHRCQADFFVRRDERLVVGIPNQVQFRQHKVESAVFRRNAESIAFLELLHALRQFFRVADQFGEGGFVSFRILILNRLRLEARGLEIRINHRLQFFRQTEIDRTHDFCGQRCGVQSCIDRFALC